MTTTARTPFPEPLALELLGNPMEQWVVALGVAAGALLLLGAARWLIARRAGRYLAARSRREAVFVGRLLQRTSSLLVCALALWIGSRFLDLPDGAAAILRAVVVLAVALQVLTWSFEAIEFVLQMFLERRGNAAGGVDPGLATAVPAMQFVGRFAVAVAIVMLALQNLGVDVTAVIAGLGVGGIAIALAVQNILGDLFASLSIVLDKPFVVGDFIVVGDKAGSVERIGLKTTRVRSLSGEQLIFANSDLLGSRIQNFKRMQERRVVFRIGVTYQTPMDTIETLPSALRQCVEAQSMARFERAHFAAYGTSSLEFEVVYWVRDAEYDTYMDVHQAINLAIGRRLGELGVDFAHPTQTLFVTRAGATRMPAPARAMNE